MKASLFFALLAVFFTFHSVPSAVAATIPVEDWVVVIGTSTVSNADSNSPTFTPADGIQVAGGFSTIDLADGQGIRGSATVVLDRTGEGNLGNNVRFALFREEGGGLPTAGDGEGYTGVSVALQNNLRDHRAPERMQPFSSGGTGAPLNMLAPAGEDPDGDIVSAQNVTLHFSMTIFRDGNALDIAGSITDGGDYSQVFSIDNYVRNDPGGEYPMDDFSWNRMAFLFAGNVNGNSATVLDANVTLIPEPMTAVLMVSAFGCGLLCRRRSV